MTNHPTYAGMSDADRTARALASLEIARWLDTASLAETIALGRCTERIEVLRKPQPAAECTPDRCSPACPLDQWSALDQALQLELTDIRIERERGEASLCVGDDHGGRYCTAEVHQPSCPIGRASEAQNRAARDQAVPTTRETLDRQAPAMAELAAMERQERPGEVAGKYVTLGWYDGPILEIARVQTSDPEVGDLLDVRSSGVGVIIDSGGYPSATLRLSRSDLQAMLAHLDGGIDHVPSEQHAAQAEDVWYRDVGGEG